MRGLLRDMPARLPTDCLLARICGRRSFLVRDWERFLLARQSLDALPSAPWRPQAADGRGWALAALQEEFYWAFSRMDEPLRRATAPFFWLGELRTLANCLRLLAGAAPDLVPLLRFSLLATGIRTLLLQAGSPAEAVAGLAAILSGYDPRFAGIEESWKSGGYAALEAALQELTLRTANGPALHPAMGTYLALMIDSRNLTDIAKRLRWRLTTLPPLLAGGTIPLPRLHELFANRDNAGLLRLAMRLGGEAAYSESAEPERVLYEAKTRVMARLSRQTDGVGAVLDYLWRCGNEAANITLLERLETAGGELVAGELRR